MTKHTGEAMHRRTLLDIAWCASAAGALAAPARAQAPEAWPARALRLIVPYPAGGTNDQVARPYADFLRQRIGQAVVVENRPGAQTNIGSEAGARAAPDGYTLLFGQASLAINAAAGPFPGFDALTALAPVGGIGRIPYVLATRPAFPARDLREAILLARREPGRYTVASAQLDFQVAAMNRRSNMEFEHVGYRGGAQATTDAIAGRVDTVFALTPVLLPHIQEGRLRALGVTGPRRAALLPGVPTFLETGESQVSAVNWFGIFVPAETPRPIVERLAAETRAFAEDAGVVQRLAAIGVEIEPSTPEELGRTLAGETAAYRQIAQEIAWRPVGER
ncbi:tripartite tricarboxylate transporter substrate-binding protein [Falsiroseomonas sp. CW058]|uniref:tripartite tricarboxylate transporter substrate-binding protein n=1 Tax=Falsiroseomonas sp. CW058 TaxID=3388664 RepID=UPI003D319036